MITANSISFFKKNSKNKIYTMKAANYSNTTAKKY